jgi:phosphoglucosamine mutase
MASIFGTDGIRGRAGEGPLAADSALRLAMAVARALGGPGRRIALGRDTRESSPMLAAAVTAGLSGAGVEVLDLGVVPTPLLSFWIARSESVHGGVMITASHNPWQDNGIKLFGANGRKVPDAAQDEAERLWIHGDLAPSDAARVVAGSAAARDEWLDDLTAVWTPARPLRQRRLLVDSAAGAAHGLLAAAFRRLGADVLDTAPRPDGRNINHRCGALHPEGLAAAVQERRAWAGVAVDGDADRVLLVDELGRIHDGDAILGYLAQHMQGRGELKGGAVVGTVASGAGLEAWLRALGLALRRTPVGDRQVAAEMDRIGANLGGESSGHVLTPDRCPTGDGTRVAVDVLCAIAQSGATVSAALGAVPRYPIAHRSLCSATKPAIESLPGLRSVIAAAELQLSAAGGRVLVRWSGTEPLLRIQVEAESADLVEAWADRLLAGAQEALACGAP